MTAVGRRTKPLARLSPTTQSWGTVFQQGANIVGSRGRRSKESSAAPAPMACRSPIRLGPVAYTPRASRITVGADQLNIVIRRSYGSSVARGPGLFAKASRSVGIFVLVE